MTENKRFVEIDDEEIYYITDTKGLKTLQDYINEFKKPEYEFTEEEALDVAKEEYWQMIYENSMSAKENVDMLNNLFEENKELKQQISYYEKLITDKDVEWLRNNTVWEQMPTSKRTFTKTIFEREIK